MMMIKKKKKNQWNYAQSKPGLSPKPSGAHRSIAKWACDGGPTEVAGPTRLRRRASRPVPVRLSVRSLGRRLGWWRIIIIIRFIAIVSTTTTTTEPIPSIHPSSSSFLEFPISFCSNRKLSRITSLLGLPSSARPLLWQLRGQPKREASSSSACSLGLCRRTDSRRALRGWIALRVAGRAMANLYVKAVPPADLNRNTEWFMYPGVWTTYILILFFSWLLVLSLTACSPGMAWTVVNLSHFLVTYHFFHWKKGTPFSEDQGIYNSLTWWEQMDNGKQLTRNRKFLTVVPVVLYLIASHTTDYQNPMLFLNTLAVIVLVVAKFPNMHKVRIFGINADK